MKSFVAVLFVGLVGCLHAPTRRPELLGAAPPSPAAVASCRSERNWHNGWTVAAGAAGGAAGVAGAAETLPTTNAGKLAVGLTSLAVGVMSIIFGAAAGFTAASYADDHCDAILSQ